MLRAICILLVFALALPLAAQEHTPGSYRNWIKKRFNEIQNDYKAGNKEQALEAALALNEEVDPYRDFMQDNAAYWWPDLLISRLAYGLRKDDLVVQFSAPAVAAMDQAKLAYGNTRLELLLQLSRALTRQKKYDQAEPVLRTLRTMMEHEDAKPKEIWRTRADYLMAITATLNNAPDAADIRKRTLDGFLEREGATQSRYLNLSLVDLRKRYSEDGTNDDLLRDAQEVYAFLTEEYTGDPMSRPKLMGVLGRIFARNKDYKSAKIIMVQKLEQLEVSNPMSVEYFFAVQNLAALEMYMNDLEVAQARILEALDLVLAVDSDRYGVVIGSLERTLAEIAIKLDQPEMAQVAYERAYIAMRRRLPVNHVKVESIKQKIDTSRVDPAIFPYAAELGLQPSDPLELTVDGTSVIAWFMAGRYRQLSRELRRIEKEKLYEPMVIHANWAVYNSLTTNPKRALDRIRAAKAAFREGSRAYHMTLLQLIELEILTTHFPRKGEEADALLAQIPDLTEDGGLPGALLAMFTIKRAEERGIRADVVRLLNKHDTLLEEHATATPWGIVLGLYQLATRFTYGEEARGLEVAFGFEKALKESGEYRLAEILAPVYRVGWQPDALASEDVFQSLAMQMRALEAMVPPKQGGYLTARINYALGLEARGRYLEAAELLDKVIDTYRTVPGFQPQVVAGLQLTRAGNLWAAGQTDVAHAMIAQVYASAIRSDWPLITVAYAINTHTGSLLSQARYEDVISVSEIALAREDFSRFDIPSQTYILLNYSDALIGLDQLDKARVALDRAVDTAPWPTYLGGIVLSSALIKRSYWGYLTDNDAQAYEDVKRSNQLWFDRRDALIAASDGDVVFDSDVDRFRVSEHAASGYNYAQQLLEAQ